MIELKNNLLLIAFGIISFFAPTAEWLMFVGFLVICDMITGIIAAKRTGNSIKSSRLVDTVFKFTAYGVAVLIAHYFSYLFFPDFNATGVITAIIATVELKSIDENFEKIFGKSLLKILINAAKQNKHNS